MVNIEELLTRVAQLEKRFDRLEHVESPIEVGGNISVPGLVKASGDIRTAGGLVVGTLIADASVGDIEASGGLVLGSTAVAGVDAGDIQASGGAYFGDATVNPTTGVVRATVGMSYLVPFCQFIATPGNLTVTGSYPFTGSVFRDGIVVGWVQSLVVLTTNDASNYWTVSLRSWGTGSTIRSFNTAAYSPGTVTSRNDTGLSITISRSTDIGLYVYCTKTGSPGTLQLGGPAVFVT